MHLFIIASLIILIFVMICMLCFQKRTSYEYLSEENRDETIILPDKCGLDYNPVTTPNPLCGGVFQNPSILNYPDPSGLITQSPTISTDNSFNYQKFGWVAQVPCEDTMHLKIPYSNQVLSLGGDIKKDYNEKGVETINGFIPNFLRTGSTEKFTNLQPRSIEYNSIGGKSHHSKPINLEQFTNEQGGNFPSEECHDLTLGDCLKTSTCDWIMKDSLDGFDSQCVSKTSKRYQKMHEYSKIYSNDDWSRSVLANDSDYKKYQDDPIFG